MHIPNNQLSLFPQYAPQRPAKESAGSMDLFESSQMDTLGSSVATTHQDAQLSLFHSQTGQARLGPGFEWNRQTSVRTDNNSLQRFLTPNSDGQIQVTGLVGARTEGGRTSSESFVGAEIQFSGQQRLHGPGVDTLLGADVRASAGRTHDFSLHNEVSQERLDLGADVKLEAGAAVELAPSLGLETRHGSRVRLGGEVSLGEQLGVEMGGGVGRDNSTGNTTFRLHGGASLFAGVEANLELTVNDADIENVARTAGGNLLGNAGMLLGGSQGAQNGRRLGEQLGDGVADAVTGTLDNIPRFANNLNRLARDASQGLNHTISMLT